MFTLLSIIAYLLYIAIIVIIVQAVMSWLIAFNVINTQNHFVSSVWTALEKLTEPLYRPIRRFLPDFGGLDLSPIVVIIIIRVLQIIVSNNMYNFQ